MAAKELIDKAIADNKVAVFSKSYCPYCKMAKSALNETGAKYYLLEIEDRGMLMERGLRRTEGREREGGGGRSERRREGMIERR